MARSLSLEYREIMRSVRPPRAMTLIPTGRGWQKSALRMMECYSRTWGGDANGLAPLPTTDEIPDPVWSLWRAFDADHWNVFWQTRRSLRLSEPKVYQKLLTQELANWVKVNGGSVDDALKFIENDTQLSAPLGPPPDTSALDERIRKELAPMASDQLAIHGTFRADEPPPQGLVDMCALVYRPDRVTTLDTSRLPLNIQLLAASTAGQWGQQHHDHLATHGTSTPSIPVSYGDLSLLLEYAWTGRVSETPGNKSRLLSGVTRSALEPDKAPPPYWTDTPLVQSRLGCTWFGKWRPGLEREPLVVVCGDSVDDFCFAFTRRRVVGNTFWFPTRPSLARSRVGRALRETLARILYLHYSGQPFGDRSVVFTSLTLAMSEVQRLVKQVSSTPWGHAFNSGAVGSLKVQAVEAKDLSSQRDTALLDEIHFGDSIFEPFVGPDMAKSVEIPLPAKAVGITPISCRWQVDVLAFDHVLPARRCLGAITNTGGEGNRWAIRSSTAGISLDSHGRMYVAAGTTLSQMLVQVRTRTPPAREIFAALLKGVDGVIEESDKGRYTRRMIELWGDLKSLAMDVRTPATRNLLTAWASNAADVGYGHVHQERRFLRLFDVMKLSGLGVFAARELLDRYVERRIATRGLELKCDRCLNTAFYRLDDLGEKFRCDRCRQRNLITRPAWRELQEPQWFYSLDEVVFQAFAANVQVPLLALDILDAPPVRSFIYMPECFVLIPGRDQIELDLWAIADGQIIVGEAKTTDRLEVSRNDEIARCEALAVLLRDLTADSFVMATARPDWHSRTRGNVERMIRPSAAIRWFTNVGA
jgi:hypothetical protein